MYMEQHQQGSSGLWVPCLDQHVRVNAGWMSKPASIPIFPTPIIQKWRSRFVPTTSYYSMWLLLGTVCFLNTLRPRQNRRHFADDIFKCIFVNENVWIPIAISLKFVPKGPINNIPALVQIMAWRRPGDKPLSEPVMFSLLTHLCVTRPQWVKRYVLLFYDKYWIWFDLIVTLVAL